MHRAALIAGLVMVIDAWQLSAAEERGRTAPANGSRAGSPSNHVPPRSPGTTPKFPVTVIRRFDPFCVYPLPVVNYYYYPPPNVFYQPVYQPVYVGPTFIEPNGRLPERAVKPKKAEEPEKPAEKPAPKPRDELVVRAEAQRLIRLGNEAFAEGHYLQAAKRYEAAANVAPFEPTAYFHLAQAQLAQGKYAEAVLAIQRGMRLRPTWPQAPFQPKALYGERAGDFQQHLAHLAELTGKNMNDDSLLFLLGYQLWFDERRDEALVLFQRAALLAFDTTFVDRFLKAKPADEAPGER
jgi:hypothetical protein